MSEGDGFRFSLKRIWSHKKPVGAFLCQNPSKADHLLTDQTMSNCNNLAVKWGWGGFWLLNLYPGYATNPKNLEKDDDTALKNAEVIGEVLKNVDMVILACGRGHKKNLKKVLRGVPPEKLFCIGKNGDGSFLHPARISVENYPSPIKAHI